MVGGGFGGSAIALVKRDNIEKTKAAVSKAFADNGFKAPRFFESLPSAGAEIIN
jgi:galactokinase